MQRQAARLECLHVCILRQMAELKKYYITVIDYGLRLYRRAVSLCTVWCHSTCKEKFVLVINSCNKKFLREKFLWVSIIYEIFSTVNYFRTTVNLFVQVWNLTLIEVVCFVLTLMVNGVLKKPDYI